MLIGKSSGMAMFLAMLSLNGVAAAGPRQPDPAEQPPPATR
jgi:hypothetical protein